jgi:ABC-type enterochelin transport system permease subunit
MVIIENEHNQALTNSVLGLSGLYTLFTIFLINF